METEPHKGLKLHTSDVFNLCFFLESGLKQAFIPFHNHFKSFDLLKVFEFSVSRAIPGSSIHPLSSPLRLSSASAFLHSGNSVTQTMSGQPAGERKAKDSRMRHEEKLSPPLAPRGVCVSLLPLMSVPGYVLEVVTKWLSGRGRESPVKGTLPR